MCRKSALPLVRPALSGKDDRRIDPEVLLDRTSKGILDGGASLDDASDRDGPPIGRLPEGYSGERTRCGRGVSVGAGNLYVDLLTAGPIAASNPAPEEPPSENRI